MLTIRSTTSLLIALAATSVNGQVYNFLLSGSQEVSAIATGAAGYGTVELSGNDITYSINYEGATLTGGHFHGAAAAGANAGVQFGFGTGSSPITGSTTLTTQQVSDLTNGLWYANLHTATNGGGELRGQVVSQLSFTPNMIISGSQEVGPVATLAGGAANVSYNVNTNLLSWDIAYEGMTATGMHFHGAAGPGSNAGVQVNIGSISGLASESTGSTTITESQEVDLLAGNWYINIHSTANPGGEIRGQVAVPEPSTYAALLGLVGIAAVAIRRRKK